MLSGDIKQNISVGIIPMHICFRLFSVILKQNKPKEKNCLLTGKTNKQKLGKVMLATSNDLKSNDSTY